MQVGRLGGSKPSKTDGQKVGPGPRSPGPESGPGPGQARDPGPRPGALVLAGLPE